MKRKYLVRNLKHTVRVSLKFFLRSFSNFFKDLGPFIRIPGANPAPDVKINGSDAPTTVSEDAPVSVRVNLSLEDRLGLAADSWIGVLTSLPFPSDRFTLVDGGGWSAGFNPYQQGPIRAMPSTEIYDMGLPPGVFYFFFVIDDNMDGVPAVQWLVYEKVTVA